MKMTAVANETENKEASNKEISRVATLAINIINLVIMFTIIWTVFCTLIPKGSWINIVDGNSMEPTLHDNQIVFTEMGEIERGDIITTYLPKDIQKLNPDKEGMLLIKRVIGLPGEEIHIKEEGIYINGTLLEEEYIPEESKQYTLKKDKRNEFTLAEDEYFVVGDNRGGSVDSRSFGPIKESDILYEQSERLTWNFALKLSMVIIMLLVDIVLYCVIESLLMKCAYWIANRRRKNMKKRKVITMFMALTLTVFTLASCGNTLDRNTQDTSTTQNESESMDESTIVGSESETDDKKGDSASGNETTESDPNGERVDSENSENDSESDDNNSESGDSNSDNSTDDTNTSATDNNTHNDANNSNNNGNSSNSNNGNSGNNNNGNSGNSNNSSNNNNTNNNNTNNSNTNGTTETISVEEQKAKKVIASITTTSMSDLDKVLAIYDWMADNIVYDLDNYIRGTIPWESYQAYGALINGQAVCDGYAKAFVLLAEEAGLGVNYVVGTADNGRGIGSHAWNQVKIDGIWYNVDITWDDEGEQASYANFLLSDEDMYKTHFPERGVPTIHKCSTTYKKKNLFEHLIATGVYGNNVRYAETLEEATTQVNALGDADVANINLWYYGNDEFSEVTEAIRGANYPVIGGIGASYGESSPELKEYRFTIMTKKDMDGMPMFSNGTEYVEIINQQFDTGVSEFYMIRAVSSYGYDPSQLRYEFEEEYVGSYNNDKYTVYRVYRTDLD